MPWSWKFNMKVPMVSPTKGIVTATCVCGVKDSHGDLCVRGIVRVLEGSTLGTGVCVPFPPQVVQLKFKRYKDGGGGHVQVIWQVMQQVMRQVMQQVMQQVLTIQHVAAQYWYATPTTASMWMRWKGHGLLPVLEDERRSHVEV